MSPVHSSTAPDFPVERHHVSPTPETLFPECPDDLSPKQVASNPAPAAGQRGSVSDRQSPDCPPAATAAQETKDLATGPVRNSVTNPSKRARARLVGIARLAAASPPAETKRRSAERPEYFVLPVKSILNRCDSQRVPFEWTINPYRGCEFACKYCYARYTHEYMELDGGEFEKKIYVKKDAGALLAWDVGHKYSYASDASGGTRPEHIAIGTATDPYQPAETEYGVTRACLEELAKREGLSVSIITKSDQIVRDIDALQHVNIAHDLVRLGDNRNAQPFPLRQFFQARARHAVFAFRRLVWVRGGPDRDVLRLGSPGSLRLIGILVRHVPGEQRASILFHVNLFLELASVKLHVFVRVPRVAILSGKLAPA